MSSNSKCWINSWKQARMRIIFPLRPSEYALLAIQSVRWFACSQILHTIHLVLILKWKPSACFCRPLLTIAGWYVWEVSWGIIAPWARTRAWQQPGQRTQDGVCDKLICDDLSSERRECDIYRYQHPVAILFSWSPYFQYLLTIVTINESHCRLFVTI